MLFFAQDPDRVDELVLALRLRWPDLTPQVVSQGRLGLEVIEKEAPELLIVGCQRFWTVLGPRDWGEEAPGLRVSLTS